MTIILVLMAACANASALVLLRKAAMTGPPAPSISFRHLWVLLRRPLWASGMVTIVLGFLLQAAALRIGAVSLVQLLLVLELPFTLILGSIVLGGTLRTREWTAIAGMTAGLTLLLYALAPRGGDPYSTGLTVWIIASTLNVAVIVGLFVLGRCRHGAAKAALFGVATGMSSGLVAVLVKAVLTAAADGGLAGVFTTWWTYLLVVTVSVGFFLLQSALQAGRLVASQPGSTLANPLVATVWGIGIFGEDVRTGGWLVGAAAGAAIIGVGAVLLSRSSLLEEQPMIALADRRGARPHVE